VLGVRVLVKLQLTLLTSGNGYDDAEPPLNSSYGSYDFTTGEDTGTSPIQVGDALPFMSLGTGQTATAIAANSHACAILTGGVKCWGLNAHGQLGLGNTMVIDVLPENMGDALPFVNLGAGQTATAIATGGQYTCAIVSGGVKCWGKNDYGQLGLGNLTDVGMSPEQMGDALPFVSLGAGQTATAVVAGGSHTCALLTGGVKCWGQNLYGQLGLGTSTYVGGAPGQMGDALPFIDFGAGQTVHALVAGAAYTCALLTGGVKCFGCASWNRRIR